MWGWLEISSSVYDLWTIKTLHHRRETLWRCLQHDDSIKQWNEATKCSARLFYILAFSSSAITTFTLFLFFLFWKLAHPNWEKRRNENVRRMVKATETVRNCVCIWWKSTPYTIVNKKYIQCSICYRILVTTSTMSSNKDVFLKVWNVHKTICKREVLCNLKRINIESQKMRRNVILTIIFYNTSFFKVIYF